MQKDSRDFDPKHRIIGAVIVVSLAVIFVPLILDRREAPSELASGAASPAAAGDSKVVVTPVRPEAAKEPAKAESPPPLTARVPESAPLAPAVVSKPAVKTVEPKAAAAKAGWVVQVGTFSSATNASRLEEQLKKHGHAVKTERVTKDSGDVTRLRVGPFRDKALALKAQTQIEKQIGVHGVVLAYP